MLRRREESITQVLGTFLRDADLETPLLQYRIVQLWAECVSPEIASKTQAIEVKNEILWVRANSPALISELTMQRTQLCMRLNERVGAQILQDVRFVM